MIDIFIPSYHRPKNIKTAKFFVGNGYDAKKIHVFIDSEADDREDYEKSCRKMGINLHVFDMDEARRRYDYIHRASESRRSAGQARNMFQDFAMANGIDFYVVQDDDTDKFQNRYMGRDILTPPSFEMIVRWFDWMEAFMRKHRIGCFGMPQSGDFYGSTYRKLFKRKIMNTTFYLMPYVYRGERGVQDNDTSMFVGMLNEGYFCGELVFGPTLVQMRSATQSGGLTDLYNECKLLNKSLIAPIQFPSAIYGCRQKRNGGRLHHRIMYRYLAPCLIKGERSNIEWDTYPEDVPFTNEPKRVFSLNR